MSDKPPVELDYAGAETMGPSRPYERKLRRIRTLGWVSVGSLFMMLLMMMSLGVWKRQFPGMRVERVSWLLPVLAITWWLGGIIYSLSKCPRCRKRFFMRDMSTNQFARRCRHCGLSISGLPDEPEDTTPP